MLANTLKDMTKSFGYEYDEDGNITAETVSTGDVSDRTVYTYDSKKQLTSAENGTTKWEYSYDSRGNILNKKEYAVTIDTDGEKVYTEKEDSTYAYDATWKDELTSFNGQSITYDASGNPLNYMGHNLTWTMGRQLASFDDITYIYNEEGIRTSKTVDGVTTKYYLNGTNIIEQTDGTTTLHFYYDSSNNLVGFNYADNDYFYVKNQQGDITDITNSNGEVVASYVYDPWGKVVSVTGSNLELANLNPFRYRSYYYDTDIQMYYLQSRYYNANVCRFINCDDINYIGLTESEASYNAFAYCENDSINRLDYDGLCYYTANLKWTHDKWENTGGYKKKKAPGIENYLFPAYYKVKYSNSCKIHFSKNSNVAAKLKDVFATVNEVYFLNSKYANEAMVVLSTQFIFRIFKTTITEYIKAGKKGSKALDALKKDIKRQIVKKIGKEVAKKIADIINIVTIDLSFFTDLIFLINNIKIIKKCVNKGSGIIIYSATFTKQASGFSPGDSYVDVTEWKMKKLINPTNHSYYITKLK